jgi:hypothetical protein
MPTSGKRIASFPATALGVRGPGPENVPETGLSVRAPRRYAARAGGCLLFAETCNNTSFRVLWGGYRPRWSQAVTAATAAVSARRGLAGHPTHPLTSNTCSNLFGWVPTVTRRERGGGHDDRDHPRAGTVIRAYLIALDPTDAQSEALRSHCEAQRYAYNFGLALIRANLDQRGAERTYGVAEEDLTPAVSWSAYSLRRASPSYAAKSSTRPPTQACASLWPTGGTRVPKHVRRAVR